MTEKLDEKYNLGAFGVIHTDKTTTEEHTKQKEMIGELKNWLIDQLTYWNNYDPRGVCFGPSVYTVEANKNVLTHVLEKIRQIEEKNDGKNEDNIG